MPEVAEAYVTLQQPEVHCVFSQGTCPWSRDPGSCGLHRLLGGGLRIVPLLAHRILGGCSSRVSVSCLSLGPI